MLEFNRVMLVLHFLGLAMGLGAGIANLTMLGLLSKATPQEKPVLARFPPMMGRFGDIGLTLLIVTGLTLTYTKWGGIGSLPWTFHAKLTAVALLVVVVGFIHMVRARVRRGDAAAAARLPLLARISMTLAILAIVFAVLTFD